MTSRKKRIVQVASLNDLLRIAQNAGLNDPLTEVSAEICWTQDMEYGDEAGRAWIWRTMMRKKDARAMQAASWEI